MSKSLFLTILNPTSDRRTSIRYWCGVQTRCRPFTDDVEDIDWAVRIKDIYKGGLKLLVERRFESGTVLNIDTATVSNDAPKALIAKVIRVALDKTGRWSLGCQFARELSSQELANFVGEAG
jgi:hypothetical protein